MSDNTKIEWADATLNYANGCSVLSPGCTNCYAMKQAHRFPVRQGLSQKTKGGMVWTGEVRLNDKALQQALAWKCGRKIFWNAHGDIFHDAVTDEAIDRLFAVCALTPQHTHMILTKRSSRMREYFAAAPWLRWLPHIHEMIGRREVSRLSYSGALPNVWLGVSVEDQTRADERIPDLLATPAAVRFVSAEPLLGALDLTRLNGRADSLATYIPLDSTTNEPAGIDWVIGGGESGPGARPMHPDWARSLRDQCAAADVAFHFKQWGEWAPHVGAVDGWLIEDNPEISRFDHRDWEGDHWGEPYRPGWSDEREDDTVSRIGKKRAGRLLDGVEHNGLPA